MVKMLARAGHQVTTPDNLATGHADAARHGELVHGDMADATPLDRLLASNRCEAVMHFAVMHRLRVLALSVTVE